MFDDKSVIEIQGPSIVKSKRILIISDTIYPFDSWIKNVRYTNLQIQFQFRSDFYESNLNSDISKNLISMGHRLEKLSLIKIEIKSF